MKQEMKKTIIFSGYITAEEPLTVTIKGASSPAGHRLPRNGGPDAPAIWPATTIRGSLRHMAHRAVVRAVKEGNNGQVPLDLADHFLLAQGVDIEGVMDAPAAGDINGIEQLGLDPMLSLFGLWGAKSKSGIGNAYPPKGSYGMFGGGARTIMFERDPSLLELLDETQRDRLDTILDEQSAASGDIQELKNKKKELTKLLKNADKDGKADLFTQMDAIDKAILARKDQKTEAKESIRRPIDQYEAIAAGTQMPHKMDLKGVSEIELGLFLAALIELARDPHMGAGERHRCGRISVEYDVKTWEPDALAPTVIGTFKFGPDGVEMTGDELKSAYQSWLDNRASIHFGKPVNE